VLLHRPGAEIEGLTEPLAVQMLAPPDPARARAQHDRLAAALRAAGVAVRLVEPTGAAPPNLMFVADLLFMTPEGAILGRPASTVRAGEERLVARRLAELGVPILRAIRGDEATCQAAGINVTYYKIASLMISAAFAGAGGAMYAHYQLQVSPQLFAVVTSITIITMVYVGGMASIYGPVGGAILLVLLTELLRNFGEWRLMIYSCTLILILFFLPNGLIAPTWRRLRASLGARE